MPYGKQRESFAGIFWESIAPLVLVVSIGFYLAIYQYDSPFVQGILGVFKAIIGFMETWFPI